MKIGVASLCALSVGCLGEDYVEEDPIVIIDGDEMGGGDEPDSGGVGPGVDMGMMGGDKVDPLFQRWLEGLVKLAQYDCTCSQGEAWKPVWNQQACVQGWERYIGGEATLRCQYNSLFSTQTNKSRCELYNNCFEVNDAKFYQCINATSCTEDGDVIYHCLDEWNRGRNVCSFEYLDVHQVMEQCRSAEDGIDERLLIGNYWYTAFSSQPKITSPIGLDWPLFDRFDDRCNSANRCTSMTLVFRENGLYSSHVYDGVVGNIYEEIYTYHESGVWGVERGRLFLSPDCKKAAVQRSGDMIFQRVFFGNIAIEKATGAPNNSEVVEDISRDYACIDEFDK